MTTEPGRDRSGLRWVRADLEQTLREARVALEEVVEGRDEAIHATIERLHHAHGVLEMVQVYGAAMLADEMERLAIALSKEQVRQPEAAAEALMLGMVQLPAYLEKIEGGAADIPLVLLPLLNDLRAAHDGQAVSEAGLFAPKLQSVIATETVRPGSGNRELPKLVLQQRGPFQRALLHWIRGDESHAALVEMHAILSGLDQAAGTARLRRLLEAAQALTSVLRDDAETPTDEVKPLFGRIDRVFKQVIDQGEEATMLDFPVDLLKQLLYYVTRSTSDDPLVVSVRQSAELANSFDEAGGEIVGALGGPDRQLFSAVADALGQDLRDVKDRLDLFIRSDRGDIARIHALAEPVQRIGDTLGMVGRGDLRSRLKRRSGELREAEAEGIVPPEDRLMALAGDLLLVEASLSNLAEGAPQAGDESEGSEGVYTQSLDSGEMHAHFVAAVDEAMVDIAKTKEAILQYLDDPQREATLGEVTTHLRGLGGVLRVLELPEAGRLLDGLVPYFEDLVAGRRRFPSEADRDAIADVVIGAECYLQAAAGAGGNRQWISRYADSALEHLASQPAVSAETGDDGPDTAAASVASATVIAFPVADPDAAPAGADDARESLPEVADGLPGAQVPPDAEVSEDVGAEPRDSTQAGEEELVEPEPGPAAAAQAEAESEPKLELLRAESTDDAVRMGPPDGVAEGPASGTPTEAPVEAPTSTVPSGAGTDIDEDDDMDAEILEIFGEEAEEELGVIQTQYPAWRASPADTEALGTLRRSFHTLKGSGRLVGAMNIGEFAWSIENLLNRVIDGTVATDDHLFAVMDDAVAVLPALVAEATQPGSEATDVSGCSARAFALASGEPLPVAEPETGEAAETEDHAEAATSGPPAEAESAAQAPETAAEGTALDEGPEDESILTALEVEDSQLTAGPGELAVDGDTSLNAVFIAEASDYITLLDGFVERCRAASAEVHFDDDLRRAMHTLRGSARTAGMQSMADLAGDLERLSNAMVSLERPVDEPLLDLLGRSSGALKGLAASLTAATPVPDWKAVHDDVLGYVDALSHHGPDLEDEHAAAAAAAEIDAFDPELLEVFLEEARELLESLETELAEWRDAIGDVAPVAQLQRTLHTMKGGARLAGIRAIGDLSHAMESLFESLTERRIEDSAAVHELIRYAADLLAQDVDQLGRGQAPEPQAGVVERLEAAAHGRDWTYGSQPPTAEPVPEEVPVDTGALDEIAIEVSEEAIDELSLPLDSETRDDLSVPMHQVSEPVEPAPVLTPEPSPISVHLSAESQLLTDSELLDDSSYLTDQGNDEDSQLSSLLTDDSTVVHFPGEPGADDRADGFVERAPLPPEEKKTASSGERVRVSAEALDQMVNHAGEVSIYRARIEQQNTTVGFNLGELQQTIDRLRSQLRDLELETEAQVLSRHERESDTRSDFDPLEMDRYSNMQQLSRALSETVEDLSNLGRSLSEVSRDTDTLLLQQARVTTDLQDALLRTRMVKFASRVPRLERVVRQTSHTLGRQASVEVRGGEEDMDRTILERMMGPLEHLLRNAVSHGIEAPEIRRAAGKPEAGNILLDLRRDGSDIVLTLADDGAGLDRERIRAKAVERGLMDADALLDDDQLFLMILKPGFSTAETLSQVSGRGVGMDVVLTEVKQLGGSLQIGSEPGRGTRFTIRLPFTLSITDSLLVTVGDEIYAVPHSSMDGVVRLPLEELRAFYTGEQETFRYADRDYRVLYLGSILGTQAPHLPDGVRWLPLLLVRSGENRVAIQVDGLLGNRQIVVKSMGAQLSTVRWFTGGTILADGQIALILDVNALVRRDVVELPTKLADEEPAAKGVSVMVVDDSITVRKVTSRLLERHNMQVMTAKDGVDAVTQLQEQQPDVVLLDIEMPRMDGFELARHMRSTPELVDIPIIMITSRTGEKHRDRAFDLGVKRYLGKPYQEADLLENIYAVLAESDG
jgi:chemosensory pili system protein ChpA (sensor histidine kinase/response regulator)